MLAQIERRKKVETATIAINTALSNAIDISNMAGGIMTMDAVAWTAANIGFKVCDTATGTFTPLYDSDTNALVEWTPAASKSYNLPDALFAAHYFKLWSHDAGAETDENQAAAHSIVLQLKA